MKYFKLPKEITLKWLEALRSGEYTQHTNELINPDKDNEGCCLGILGLVCNIDNKEMWGRSMPQGLPVIMTNDDYPDELKAGINDDLADILALLNDGYNMDHMVNYLQKYPKIDIPENCIEGFSFKEIADFIEKYCELYE